jgi:hypothetical protein
MRVNARLDEAAQEQMKYLTESTGQGVSHVVRQAVAHYYLHVRQAKHPVPSKFLAMVGTGHSGRSDIASNVKKYVAEALEAKLARSHPPAVPKRGR